MSIPQNTPTDGKKGLSAKQRRVIPLLATGNTIAAASQTVGVNESTVDDWKRQPHFMEALHKAEDDLYQDALDLLKKTAKAAIVCLMRNMGEKVSPYVQVSAAGKLLDLGLQVHRLSELELKIAELEALMKQQAER